MLIVFINLVVYDAVGRVYDVIGHVYLYDASGRVQYTVRRVYGAVACTILYVVIMMHKLP